MISDEVGAQKVIALQKLVGITMEEKEALHAWKSFSFEEREQTIAAHHILCR
jgi:hypothetical protein